MTIYDYIIISPSIWIKIIYKSYEIHKNTDLKLLLYRQDIYLLEQVSPFTLQHYRDAQCNMRNMS